MKIFIKSELLATWGDSFIPMLVVKVLKPHVKCTENLNMITFTIPLWWHYGVEIRAFILWVTHGDIKDNLRPGLLLLNRYLKSTRLSILLSLLVCQIFILYYLQLCRSSHIWELRHQKSVWRGSAVMAAEDPEFHNMYTLKRKKSSLLLYKGRKPYILMTKRKKCDRNVMLR